MTRAPLSFRLDEPTRALVERHRAWLSERAGGAAVTWADAARDLLVRGLKSRGLAPRRPKRGRPRNVPDVHQLDWTELLERAAPARPPSGRLDS